MWIETVGPVYKEPNGIRKQAMNLCMKVAMSENVNNIVWKYLFKVNNRYTKKGPWKLF